MDLSSSKVSGPCMNMEAVCSDQNKVIGRTAELKERKRQSDRMYRQRVKIKMKLMNEEIRRIKESITQVPSNQQISAPILKKLECSFSQPTSQQHDAEGVSVQMGAETKQLKEEIRRLSTENGLLKERTEILRTKNELLEGETGRLSIENRYKKEEIERLSIEHIYLKEQTERLRVENRHLKEENIRLNLENKRLVDDIKGLRGKIQILEVPQRLDSRISQPTCQNNLCTENFGNEGAVVGMELESSTSKNSFFKSEFDRLTDEIRRLQEDITWLRPDWHFPDRDLSKLGNHFFLSTSQQHNDDKSVSVQSCGFQDVQKTGSSDAATNQNHTEDNS